MVEYVRKPITYNAIQYTGDVAAFQDALTAAPSQVSFKVYQGSANVLVKCIATAFNVYVEIGSGQYLVFLTHSQNEQPYTSDLSDLVPYEDIYVTNQ